MRRGHLNYYPGGASEQHDLPYGWKIKGPEYHKLGEEFDVHGAKVDSVAALPGAIRDALAATKAGKTAILNVILRALRSACSRDLACTRIPLSPSYTVTGSGRGAATSTPP